MAKNVKDGQENALAQMIRSAIKRRGLVQKTVAKRIGLSEAAFSRIINGRARPREATFWQIIRTLQISGEDAQQIWAAFGNPNHKELPPRLSAPEIDGEVNTARRLMELQALEIGFEQDVARILRKFKRRFQRGECACDFFFDGFPRIAVICKLAIHRDWEHVPVTVRLLREGLDCEQVIFVVPYINELASAIKCKVEPDKGTILDINALPYHLPRHLK